MEGTYVGFDCVGGWGACGASGVGRPRDDASNEGFCRCEEA